MAKTDQPESDKSDADKSSGRWWEYYFIRYFAGTVVGGLILANAGVKYSNLPVVSDVSGSFEVLAKSFAALAALSFAYCYVASAPMLTLHATRAYLLRAVEMVGSVQNSRRAVKILLIGCIVLVVLVILVALGVALAYVAFGLREGSPISWVYLIGFSLISVFQFILIGIAFCTVGRPITKFYKGLSDTRAKKTSKEYVESYRHLREHSNAYGIIVLEFVLAPAVVWAWGTKWITVVFLIWLLPPALCWAIATMLESVLVSSPGDFPSSEAKKPE